MTTDELPLEKCIADDLSHPPVPTPEMLASTDIGESPGSPPQTRLLLGGFEPDELSAGFLVDIHELADEHDLDLESIFVGRHDRDCC